jgi:hypothetical protein
VGYFETQRGLPPEAEEYSAEFLEIDAVAGPWLGEWQARSPVARAGLDEWRLDLERGAIAFGDPQRIGAVASVQLLGTYDSEERVWLWAWANPRLDEVSAASAKVRDQYPDLPELSAPSQRGGETKAWALAAAAAHLLQAEGCYRLPGEGTISTFVALFAVEELAPDDPRARVGADPEAAAEALESYAGPAALSIGALVVECLEAKPPCFDPAIEAIHAFCDNLDALERSPLGGGTPAGREACELALLLRQGALCLALPPNDPSISEGVEELLGLLHHLAQRYRALPEEPGGAAS